MALDKIADARVHLSYPIAANNRSQAPMKASVIVFYHDENQDIDELKLGIKHLLKMRSVNWSRNILRCS